MPSKDRTVTELLRDRHPFFIVFVRNIPSPFYLREDCKGYWKGNLSDDATLATPYRTKDEAEKAAADFFRLINKSGNDLEKIALRRAVADVLLAKPAVKTTPKGKVSCAGTLRDDERKRKREEKEKLAKEKAAAKKATAKK